MFVCAYRWIPMMRWIIKVPGNNPTYPQATGYAGIGGESCEFLNTHEATGIC